MRHRVFQCDGQVLTVGQFIKLASGINVLPVALELSRIAHRWNEYDVRKTYAGTPHAGMDDIYVRYRDRAEIKGPASHNDAGYRNVWWSAWPELPSLRPIVFALMSTVSAVELGSVLLTRLPPGGKILPHSDAGSWAPGFYNCKVHVTIAGRSISRCGGDQVEMVQGDAYEFDNLTEHSVENLGPGERIVCIVSMRCEA